MITPLAFSTSLADAPPETRDELLTAREPRYLEPVSRRRRGAPSRSIGVLHVINGEHYAGAERVQDLLGQRLPEFGFSVGYACVKPGQFAARRISQHAALYNVPMHSRYDMRPAWRLASLIRAHGYRLIHTHTPRSAMVGALAAKLAGVPMVHHAHGQTLIEVNGRWRLRVAAAAERLSMSTARRIIAVSPSVGRYLERQAIPADRIAVVANGVPSSPQRAARPVGRGPNDAWTVGTVALFRPRKGTEMLLNSVAELRAQGLNVRLRAVGPFETRAYEAEVKARAQALGLQAHVDWIGFSPNVNRELAEMDLMVLPSLLAEGLPMVVLEAMASGIPPVGTRVDGITDVIRHEVDGLLCEPRSSSISEQIARVVRGDLDWQSLSDEAFQRHQDCYSDQSMARRLAEIYRELLET